MRSKQKLKPHENAVRVLFTWAILQMEMNSDLKKNEHGSAQSAEYVKYAKIFGDYFWLIFIPTEDLGDPFLLILCLLKILTTHSCRFYAY